MKIEQKHFDAMIAGTKCKFWNNTTYETTEGTLHSISKGAYPFEQKEKNSISPKVYENCEPKKTETYVKEWFEIAKQLHMDGYKIDGNDLCKYKTQTWYNDMWKTCGKKYYDYKHDFEYLPEWLEERES